jgi:hypothetical protein
VSVASHASSTSHRPASIGVILRLRPAHASGANADHSTTLGQQAYTCYGY